MSQRLRWGILGTGNIARQFSVGVIASRRSMLTAVGSRTDESAATFARAHHIPSAHGSYQALLADPQVDAIYNSLPNSLHHKWTIAALKAGKHVLCEKPFAINIVQAQEMFDVARHQGRLVVEAFMYRSHPLTTAVKKAIAAGAIGELNSIRSSFCYRTTKITGNVRFDAQLAGGSLMDVGCYCINFSRFFAGAEPDRVHAIAHLHDTGVDDRVVATLGFPNGILASFACGMSSQADNSAMLCGTEGFIEIPVPWKPPAPESIFVIARGVPPKMDGPSKVTGTPARETIRVKVDGDLYGIEADVFAGCVLDGDTPLDLIGGHAGKYARAGSDQSTDSRFMMKILGNTGGVFATNSYLVMDEDSKQAVIFDAPNDTTPPLLRFAVDNAAEVIGLWLTHGHIDHIADHAVVKSQFPKSKLLLHALDEPKLKDPNSMYPLPFKTPGRGVDEFIVDSQTLHIGKYQVNVIHTPGHSPGHVAFYIPSEKTLIGGDLILMGAVGRTDFPDCSFADLQASLRRIMQLPTDTQLLPGHGHPSLLGEELAQNPYVRQAMEIRE